jgi:hypothetical protein
VDLLQLAATHKGGGVMLPGLGDLAMREFDRACAEYDRSNTECRDCGDSKPNSEMVSTFPNPGWNTCQACECLLRPRCECDCGQRAQIVADIRWPGGIDCRAPFVDVKHALAGVAASFTVPPGIDVVLDEDGFKAVIELASLGRNAPCWCGMAKMTFTHGAFTAHTSVAWCPTHGSETPEE